jgi:hypothetical protein
VEDGAVFCQQTKQASPGRKNFRATARKLFLTTSFEQKKFPLLEIFSCGGSRGHVLSADKTGESG